MLTLLSFAKNSFYCGPSDYYKELLQQHTIFYIQMIAQNLSATSGIRRLCYDIENSINGIVNSLAAKGKPQEQETSSQGSRNGPQYTRKDVQRWLQEAKGAIINCISSSLPSVIDFEQGIRDKLEDAEQEREEWRQKYKRIFKLHEGSQLESDKLKMQIITLSQNYEAISLDYEQLKFKYHELKQTHEQRVKQLQSQVLDQKVTQLNKITSSGSNSLDSERDTISANIKNENEVLIEERELFLEEIRQSQQDLLSFKNQLQKIARDNELLQKDNQRGGRENKELQQLMSGEQARCEKLDRQIIDLINHSQELKLQLLEKQEVIEQKEVSIEALRGDVLNRDDRVAQLSQQKEALCAEAIQLKQESVQLRGQNSQHRQKFIELEQITRQMKVKQSDSNKQNQTLREQIQKLLKQLSETTASLKSEHRDEVKQLTEQLQIEKTRNTQHQQDSSKKSNDKVQDISRMHREITGKLQQKIHLLEKGSKEKKEKISQLKFEVERLYESLKIQVEKQYKSVDKIKELAQARDKLMKANRQIEERLKGIEEKYEGNEENAAVLKSQLRQKERKLKKVGEMHSKLLKIVLPNLKEELHNTKLACSHFSKVVEMEKQQTSFLLQAKHENFSRLLTQINLQQQLTTEHQALANSQELNKWKDTAKNYEDRYSQLRQAYDVMGEKNREIERQMDLKTEAHRKVVEQLQDKLDRQQLENFSTLKNVQKLKEKCKEVEQYYKLVEQLQKENFKLKENLNHLQTYSFKGDPFEHTKPRQQLTSPNRTQPNATVPNQASQTSLTNYISRPQNQNLNSNVTVQSIASKCDHHKQRLQAVKREHELMRHQQY